MDNNPPPLIFGLLGIIVGVGVAWVITKDSQMALFVLIAAVFALVLKRVIDRRRRDR